MDCPYDVDWCDRDRRWCGECSADAADRAVDAEDWAAIRTLTEGGGGNVDGVNTSAGRVDETGSCKQVEGGTGKEPKE
jgi:hypothetical protein